jgi:hypothetical protein
MFVQYFKTGSLSSEKNGAPMPSDRLPKGFTRQKAHPAFLGLFWEIINDRKVFSCRALRLCSKTNTRFQTRKEVHYG